MTAQQESGEVRKRLDDLRRRLYRDGATADDLSRYTEEQEALRPADAPAPGPAGIRVGRARRPVLAAAAGTLLLAGVIGAGLIARPGTQPPAPTATPRAFFILREIGDGQTLTQTADVVRDQARTAVSLDGTAAVAQQFHGVGDAVVAVDTAGASYEGGRVLVALSSTQSSPIAWRALRVVTRFDWTSYAEIVARGTARSRAGVASPAVFAYAGIPPSRIAVEAPDDLRWTLQVAFAAEEAPGLR